MYRLIFAIFLILNPLGCSGNEDATQPDYENIPRCISELCLQGNIINLPTEDKVLKLIGSNQKTKSSIPHRRSSCHIISTPKHENVYAELVFIQTESKWRLITIAVSLQKLCDEPEELFVDFEFLTDKNIGFGREQSEIIATHGKPKYILTPPPARVIKDRFPYTSSPVDTIVQYVADENELLTTRFYLLNNKVIGIELSADE